MTSFMDDYRAGRSDGSDLPERIHYWFTEIDWRTDGVGLEEYLGMSWAEFNRLWLHNQLPSRDPRTAGPAPAPTACTPVSRRRTSR